MITKKKDIVFPRISPLGDKGLLIEFGNHFEISSNKKALALDFLINNSLPKGVQETTPTLISLMVRFNPLEITYGHLKEKILFFLEKDLETPTHLGRSFVIPAVYGGDDGPDLEEISDLMGLRSDQVVSSHTESQQQVMMLGFGAGCSYCGLLPQVWNIPRGEKVKPSVPGGSLLIALRQTVFPATPMPTGWRRIGTSPCLTFNLNKEPKFLLNAGDSIRFEQVSKNKARSISDDILWETFEK
jgi:KipI family sensor histidine kinase inhibitor